MNSSKVPFRNEVVLLAALLHCRLAVADAPRPPPPAPEQVKILLQLNGNADMASQLGPITAQQVVATLHKTIPNLPARADNLITNVVTDYVLEQAAQRSVTDMLVPTTRNI